MKGYIDISEGDKMSFQPKSVVIGVIMGLFLGVGVGYFICIPQINRLKQETTDLPLKSIKTMLK